MIKFINVQVQQIAVHQVGNKAYDEELHFSDVLINIADDKLINIFLKYFLSPFSGNEMYQLYNDVGIEQNEIFALASRIFNNSDDLFSQSKLIAQHLYNCSTHPKIKGGELYVSYFKDIIIDDNVTDVIGIFKSENKENYIKVDLKEPSQLVNFDEGTNINKLDKGCLIFNLDKENGYKVCIPDNLNKSNEATYWKENFLGIQPIKNEFHQTNQFLGITKQFVTKQLTEDFDVSKADQIDFLNRSVDYFKTRNIFDKQEFEEEVFSNNSVIESFRKFDQTYRQENEVDLSDNFEISPQAVKKQARVFKSVLKLDKNFHIYIHGNRELIEQGTDGNGRKYYKIYYENEA